MRVSKGVRGLKACRDRGSMEWWGRLDRRVVEVGWGSGS